MPAPIDLAIGICALLITYVYPFVAVWRGKTIKEATLTSWLMQVAYFTVLCLGIPGLGSYFSRQLGAKMAMLMPEERILVPTFVCGWLAPWIVGSIAASIRPARRP